MKARAKKLLAVKPFRQTSGYCGPASLKMVLGYYGVEKSERELARLSGATRERGVGGAKLVAAAKRLGFNARLEDFSTLADIKKFVRRGIPVIVDWFSVDEGHYSVVVGITPRDILLQDPELGRVRKMDLVTFKRVWFDFHGDFLRARRDVVVRRMVVVHPRTARRSEA